MGLIDQIREYLGADWTAFNAGIEKYLGSDIDMLNSTNERLIAGCGKQLRPAMSLLIARACGGGVANGDSVKYAVAAELLHNATLLHDDVADESDCRRGVPTLRKLMGPTVAVLVGDFWLVRAVRAILEADSGRERVLDIFGSTLSHLAEGEMIQLQKAESCDTVMEDYMTIIHHKTASLFNAVARTAAISVNADARTEMAVGEFGTCIGYAFQMKDDMFDYMPGAQIGKPVGIDVMERKITLPFLCALDNVSAGEAARMRNALRNVNEGTKDGIIDFVRTNGGLVAAQSVLLEYLDKAVEALAPLPESKEKDLLLMLAGYMGVRNR